MADNDKVSFDPFMLSVGIFLGLIIGVVFLARMNAIDAQGRFDLDDPQVQSEIAERIAPIGRVVLLGDEQLAAAAAAATAAPAPVEATLTGPQVYNEACYLCHAAPGVGGAPIIGDVAAWTDRIAQGVDTLNDHAISGYQGEAGFMPAKGGRVDLSDEEIFLAVQYMIDEASP